MSAKQVIDEIRTWIQARNNPFKQPDLTNLIEVGRSSAFQEFYEYVDELEQKYCSEHQSEQIKKPKFKTDDRVKETNSDIVFKVIGIEFEPPYHWRYLIKGEDDEYCVGESYESELELVEEPQAEGNIITKNEGEEK